MKAFFLDLFRRYPRPVLCVALSLALGLLIYFRAQVLPDLRDRYEAGNRQLDAMLRNQSQGAQLSDELKELKRLTAGLQDRLVLADDRAANFQFFYDIEAKSHATIAELRQLTTAQGEGLLRPKLDEFTATSFNLTVSGRVGYVMLFLKRLESGKYFVRCNSAAFKGNALLAPDAVDVVLKLEVLTKK